MSEDNSGSGKQGQSSAQVDGEQAEYLDSLIAQFQSESDADWPQATANDGVAENEPEISEPDLSPADAATANEQVGVPEPGQQSNTLNYLLAGIVSIALIGVIWSASGGDDDKHAVNDVAQSETKTMPVLKGASAPVVAKNRPLQADRSEQVESSASVRKQAQADVLEARETAGSAQHPEDAPSSSPVVTPRTGKTAWVVNLTSVSTLAMAGQIQKELGSRGIETKRVQVTVAGKPYYRIFVPGFSSKQEAGLARLPFLKESEFSGAWVTRYQTAIRSPE
ncbi:sporulation related domain protein [Mariprofundus micogutta]|uniref:Sporulation related domain protein n=1 Tax=Mariprofundus micogutta TaxID=1921010 RepID=A0A1L8CPX1_9PROT|nr:SPOR domain-containing protein [Mariprofundus micogutta]GAV20972.1 sporulation related domain protein [Mariprofundus micogutta]